MRPIAARSVRARTGKSPEIDGGQEDLWLINSDGTAMRRLTSPKDGLIGGANPVWAVVPGG